MSNVQNILTQKMALWAYARWPEKWFFEHTLKDPKNDPLSVGSRAQKMTLWMYAQGPKKWPIERTLKAQKMTLWAYAQSLFEDTFLLHIFTWKLLFNNIHSKHLNWMMGHLWSFDHDTADILACFNFERYIPLQLLML